MKTLYVVHDTGDTYSFQVSSWEVSDSGCLLLYQENEDHLETVHTAFARKQWEYASHTNPFDLEEVKRQNRDEDTRPES